MHACTQERETSCSIDLAWLANTTSFRKRACVTLSHWRKQECVLENDIGNGFENGHSNESQVWLLMSPFEVAVTSE